MKPLENLPIKAFITVLYCLAVSVARVIDHCKLSQTIATENGGTRGGRQRPLCVPAVARAPWKPRQLSSTEAIIRVGRHRAVTTRRMADSLIPPPCSNAIILARMDARFLNVYGSLPSLIPARTITCNIQCCDMPLCYHGLSNRPVIISNIE